MTKISGWKSVGSTYQPALAMLFIWLMLTALDSVTGSSTIYNAIGLFSVPLCFAWIFKILRRDEFGRGGNKTRLLAQFSTALVLTLAYSFVVFWVSFIFKVMNFGIH